MKTRVIYALLLMLAASCALAQPHSGRAQRTYCAYRKSDLQPEAGTQSYRPDEANGQGT